MALDGIMKKGESEKTDTKFVLHPQTPSQVAKDQIQIKLKWDEEKIVSSSLYY